MADRKDCFCNRELSWLKFNERVLNEAGNPNVPLAERLTFASIYQTNLDEFFMVRVGTLMTQMQSDEKITDNKTNMTSKQQVKAILKKTKELDEKKARIYEQLMGELEPCGVRIINFNKLSLDEGHILETYFDNHIAPFLMPMIIDRQQPFPFLNSKALYAVVILGSKSGKEKIGLVPCTNDVFKRLIEIPTRPGTFMLSEELILHFVSKLYKKYTILEKSILRVTRNADIDADTVYDEDMDFRDLMQELIKRRKKLSPVRIELSRLINEDMVKRLCKFCGLSKKHVFFSDTPLDLSYVFLLQSYLKDKQEDLFYDKRSSRMPASVNLKRSMIAQIEKKDILLHYPYESIRPFLDLLHEAAEDDEVTSIRMTLYRVANKSKVVEALCEAAENGKEVVALMELRARFDEENNIEWSRKLEDAGCRVIYGLGDYKVHSKLCLITKKTKDGGHSYITQIGTGNYNEKTASLYTDLSLMTADQRIGEDASKVFAALLMGETVEDMEHLLVAPNCLQSKVLAMMDREIIKARTGKKAYIGLKLNSLTDKTLINKLIEASMAGVKIEMIIRGICCLVPGIEGYTENITVISIVGRFLEHARIYRFGSGNAEKMYIASADFMTRNTLRRVEVATPIYDRAARAKIRHIFNTQFQDTEKGKIQNAQGIYLDREPLEGEKLNSQELFYEEAYKAEARKAQPRTRKQAKRV